ncbi:beta-N-acetylhexosaminidase [Cohnella yongneupensis]|uniref:beta-N-acetylhexosaminidase n=1 Tax=Cohnella yongneupensis TaxID=425006 RepID=A0ABW0R5I7_9BACL
MERRMHQKYDWHRTKITGAMLMLLLFASGCSGGNNGNEPAAPLPIDQGTATETSAPTPTATVIPSTAPVETPTPTPTPTPSESAEVDEVSAIMAKMTLEEKVGQMLMIGVDGTTLDRTAEKLIKNSHAGGVIVYADNLQRLDESVKLINAIKAANKDNAAPLLLGVDQEGQKVSRLPKDFEGIPDSATVGKSGDAEIAKSLGGLLAEELRVMGLNLDFAPVLDINSNPHNPIIGVRSFGNNAELVAKMGVAEMNGLQESGVIAAVKHFPGHGDTSVDSHLSLPVVRKTLEQLQQQEWIPFQSAINNGAEIVMVAHILFPLIDNKAPASFSKVIISDQLRGELGFNGVVITDEMTMGAIVNHFGTVNAALKSVDAGSDILMVAHDYVKMQSVYDELLKSVKSGKVKESRIDESVRRILTLKLKYGLSDAPTPIPTAADIPNAQIREWKSALQKAIAKK